MPVKSLSFALGIALFSNPALADRLKLVCPELPGGYKEPIVYHLDFVKEPKVLRVEARPADDRQKATSVLPWKRDYLPSERTSESLPHQYRFKFQVDAPGVVVFSVLTLNTQTEQLEEQTYVNVEAMSDGQLLIRKAKCREAAQ